MNDNRHVANGAFVTLAAALAVLLLVALGAFRNARSSRLFETYIEESAQGLSPGSAVRFRGVPVGSVESIGFAYAAYPAAADAESRRQGRYTRIVFSIKREFLPRPEDEDAPTMERLVADGLRVNVRNQGITGLRYLDLDVVSEPLRRKTLPVSWKPELEYVPAAPSLSTTFASLLENAAAQLSGVDFGAAARDLASLVANANAATTEIRASVEDGAPVFARAMHALRNAATALDELAGRLRDDPSSLFRQADDE